MILDPECDFTVGSLPLHFSVFCQDECEYIETFQIQQSNIPMRRKYFIPSRMWCLILFFFKCLVEMVKKEKKNQHDWF